MVCTAVNRHPKNDRQTIHFKFYPPDRSLNKHLFVEYKHPATGKFQKYGNLVRCFTVPKKIKEAERIINELKVELPLVPSKVDAYLDLDLSRMVQLAFEERSPYLNLKAYQPSEPKLWSLSSGIGFMRTGLKLCRWALVLDL